MAQGFAPVGGIFGMAVSAPSVPIEYCEILPCALFVT
jgi:hypothetical protein